MSFGKDISTTDYEPKWTVPSRAHKGDLLLFYLTKPDKCIKDIFVLKGPVSEIEYVYDDGQLGQLDYEGPIRRLCPVLKAPVFWEDLKRHRILQTAGFVRSQLRGRSNATEYWPYLHELIVRRNPSIKKRIEKYAPDRLPTL